MIRCSSLYIGSKYYEFIFFRIIWWLDLFIFWEYLWFRRRGLHLLIFIYRGASSNRINLTKWLILLNDERFWCLLALILPYWDIEGLSPFYAKGEKAIIWHQIQPGTWLNNNLDSRPSCDSDILSRNQYNLRNE